MNIPGTHPLMSFEQFVEALKNAKERAKQAEDLYQNLAQLFGWKENKDDREISKFLGGLYGFGEKRQEQLNQSF